MFKKFLIISIAFFFSQILFSQQGWYQLTSGTSNNLRSVYFIDSNTGYAVGYGGTILKTTNGGVNWISQQLTAEDLYSVHFIGQTGFIAGGTQYNPVIFRTTNGGINWQSQVVVGTYHLHSVFMTNSDRAHAVSDAGKIIKTTNGGINWTVFTINPNTYHLRQVFFADSNTGYIIGGYTLHAGIGILLRTNDGGSSWSVLNNFEWLSIYFVNSETGYGTSVGGSVRKTINSGTNWTSQSLSNSTYLTTIWFTNPSTGYVAGFLYTPYTTGRIFKTINAGTNWFEQTVPQTNQLNSINFADVNTGYAVGNNGTIFKTTNGGVTALEPISNEIPKEYKLFQNYPNPFNPVTKIIFSIPSSETHSNASLRVFDILGREVVTLVNEELKPGTYEVEFDGNNLSSGIYYYSLQIEQFSDTKKMVLIR